MAYKPAALVPALPPSNLLGSRPFLERDQDHLLFSLACLVGQREPQVGQLALIRAPRGEAEEEKEEEEEEEEASKAFKELLVAARSPVLIGRAKAAHASPLVYALASLPRKVVQPAAAAATASIS